MEINILYSCDNAYVPQTLVSMLSLLDSNRDEDVRIYLAGDHLTEANKQRINDSLARAGTQPIHLDLDGLLWDRLPESHARAGRHARTIYAKLSADRICNSKNLLYLDSDTVVAGSLRPLFDGGLDGYLAAGVRMPYSEKKLRTLFGEGEADYICDGVVWINLEAWKKENTAEHCARYLRESRGTPAMLSEGVLNQVCRGRIKILEPKYNVMPHMLLLRADQIKSLFRINPYYSDRQIQEAREHPVIIHYLAELFERPWCEGSDHPEKERYYHYCRLGKIEPVISGRTVSHKTNLTKSALRSFPFPLVRLLYRIVHFGEN